MSVQKLILYIFGNSGCPLGKNTWFIYLYCKMIKGYYIFIERIALGVRDQPQLHLDLQYILGSLYYERKVLIKKIIKIVKGKSLINTRIIHCSTWSQYIIPLWSYNRSPLYEKKIILSRHSLRFNKNILIISLKRSNFFGG